MKASTKCLVAPIMPQKSPPSGSPCFGQLDLACTRPCSLLFFSSPIPIALGISTMIVFVKEYLLGLLGLLATLLSGFLPPRAKRLAGHLHHVPYLGAFLRLVAPPAPAQPLPPPLPPPLLPDPVRVSIRQEDEERWTAVITRGVDDGIKGLFANKEEECRLLREQNTLLRRLVELEEQRPAYTYDLVRLPVTRPPAAPVASGPSSG